jgi:glycosyltransferase involved in cell wall biosynthesis
MTAVELETRRPADRLHVALNLVFLHERSGGVGRYARELIPALLTTEPTIRISAFASKELPEDVRCAAWATEVDWIRLPVRTSGGPPGAFAAALAAQWLALPVLAAARRVDVVHGLANVTPLWMPGCARIVTLLDLIWMHFPEALEPAAARGMKRATLPSVKRADRIVTISHAARDDIVSTLGVSPQRVDVTPLGVSPADAGSATPERELRARMDLADERIVATIGAGRVHKNLARLVRAFGAIARDDCALVIAGDLSRQHDELLELAASCGVDRRLRMPGWLSPADHEGLFEISTCFVVPSLMEGFGLPVLEAMQRGVPVACSRTSATGEVAQGAAELFDPLSESGIAAAIQRLLEDPARREELVRLGKERCAQYTWQATARATLASYARALGARRDDRRGPAKIHGRECA